MSIIFETPPNELLQGLDSLIEIIHPSDLPLRELIKQIQNQPDQFTPHPIYTLDPAALAEGAGVEHLEFSGVRFIGSTSDSRTYGVEIDAEGAGHINQGPFVQGTLETLGYLDESVGQDGDFLISVLRCHPLYIMALFLRNPENEEMSLIVPMPPIDGIFEAGRPYQLPEFADIAAELAQRAGSGEELI